MEQYIYLSNKVHKDQLRALLKACGFETVPETFRALKEQPSGGYSNTLVRVTDGKAVCLSSDEAEPYLATSRHQQMHEVLGPKAITNARITDVHPQHGYKPLEAAAFISADIYGLPMSPMPIGKTLYDQWLRGIHTPLQIASGIFRDSLVEYYRQVRTQVDCGTRWSDGVRTIYYGDTMDGVYHYKDLTAFDEKDGVCLISEANLHDYEADMKDGKEIDMSRYADEYHELVSYARDLALRNPEQAARRAVENATWQSAFTELEEFHNNCEPEDILTLDEEVQDKYDMYVEEHGKQPNYAEVYIEWKDDQASQRDMIALNEEAGEYADEEVAFTCSSFDDFKRLTNEDNGEDFVIREIYGYHSGSMDGQKRVFSDIDSTDQGATIYETEEQYDERIIEIDMDMTPRQLKDVLAKEGIKLLDVLPGIDEPLPLDKDNNNVAHVYLRVACDSVIDWAPDYMYRDAATHDTDMNISKLSHIVLSHEQLAIENGQQTHENDRLLRITDVRIYRNPQNTSTTEFRIRCKIDGEQQLGRILTPWQIEELANGFDRTHMAAEIFAREMTLNKPQERERQNGMGL